MNKCLCKIKGIKNKTAKKLSEVQFKLFSMLTAGAVWLMGAIPVSAATTLQITDSTDTSTLVAGVLDFIVKVAFYIGIVVMATGVFMLVLAYKDDNAEGQTRGVRMAIVGACLVGFRALLVVAGIIAS